MTTTIAFGHDKKVALWATFEEPLDDGSFEFDVINGGWRGVFYPDISSMAIEGGPPNELKPIEKLWVGEVPRHFRNDYNGAIGWIEEQIA